MFIYIQIALLVGSLYLTAAEIYVEPILQQETIFGDEGQYKYGYKTYNSSRDEVRGTDGITRGHYSYIDDNGDTQYVQYTAGDDGFKVQGTNLPVHISLVTETPEVMAARSAHEAAHLLAKNLAIRSGISNNDPLESVPNQQALPPRAHPIPNNPAVSSVRNTNTIIAEANINLFSGQPLSKVPNQVNNAKAAVTSAPLPIIYSLQSELGAPLQSVQSDGQGGFFGGKGPVDLLSYRRQIVVDERDVSHLRYKTLEEHRSDQVQELGNAGVPVPRHQEQLDLLNYRRQLPSSESDEFIIRQQAVAIAAAKAFRALVN